MSKNVYSKWQKISLVLLRVLIGWHFLYEGILKLYNPAWSAKGYLLSSQGFLSSFFAWMAHDSIVKLIDPLMIVGLMAVGAGLMLGVFTRWSALIGCFILLMFYLAHPAFPGLEQPLSTGNYWIVNNNLIEVAALLVIYKFPILSQYFSIDSIFEKRNLSQNNTGHSSQLN